ncbi:MAG: succinate-semialdehyde dehydrogenase / glutarate-semialdehyde dehydrogenase [Candidatus Atribacteria bacterium]|nr:succinate-semialdehyde dehydrogenase / glutarate-semialdehyde dehydrogenase [Candidatus Atribacteria bacterium]
MLHYSSFINGRWQTGEGEIKVVDPSNGEIFATVSKVTVNQIKEAIEGAHQAFQDWSQRLASERARLLFQAAGKARERAENIGHLLAQEQGKAFPDAKKEVLGAADCLEYYGSLAMNIVGEIPPNSASHLQSLAIRQPVGVVFAVAAWNYPVSLISWKVAPALAAGCTVIVKPSRETPLATIEFVKAINEAGLPTGVLNAISGDNALISQEIFSDPRVRLVALTGSTETGKEFIRASAQTVKRLILELGGHSPFIVFSDADLEKAIKDGVKRAFRNTGQICNSVNRLLVEEKIKDNYVKAFVEATQKLRLGGAFEEPVPDLGPMVNQAGVDRMKEFIEDARIKGGKVLCGGKQPDDPQLQKGFYFEPTVITNVSPDMKIMQEEPFGPVVAIDSFQSVEEAIKKANGVRYGLVAYLYTQDMKKAFQVAERLEWGSVAINNISPDSLYAPYPGWKESGLGVELGHQGLEEYLEWKHIKWEVM